LVSNLWRSPELGLAAPRPEPADKTFQETRNRDAIRAVPDRSEDRPESETVKAAPTA
ncbi:MAG: hypothetical protein JWN60_1308, partial [Acidobacteria bacterium]|nr:hypothetical protein [Acidobacteriota bacterium]